MAAKMQETPFSLHERNTLLILPYANRAMLKTAIKGYLLYYTCICFISLHREQKLAGRNQPDDIKISIAYFFRNCPFSYYCKMFVCLFHGNRHARE